MLIFDIPKEILKEIAKYLSNSELRNIIISSKEFNFITEILDERYKSYYIKARARVYKREIEINLPENLDITEIYQYFKEIITPKVNKFKFQNIRKGDILMITNYLLLDADSPYFIYNGEEFEFVPEFISENYLTPTFFPPKYWSSISCITLDIRKFRDQIMKNIRCSDLTIEYGIKDNKVTNYIAFNSKFIHKGIEYLIIFDSKRYISYFRDKESIVKWVNLDTDIVFTNNSGSTIPKGIKDRIYFNPFKLFSEIDCDLKDFYRSELNKIINITQYLAKKFLIKSDILSNIDIVIDLLNNRYNSNAISYYLKKIFECVESIIDPISFPS